ncbi:hypothetical protein CY34DRAFT_46146, partial [Suillus luteus UH-Slu-Lm8-n1]
IHQEYLRTLNLTINKELRIICCEICRVAITPDAAKAHIKNEHSHTTFDAMKFIKALKEEGIRSDLPIISNPRSRVEGLAVHDALACGHCNKVLTSAKGMYNHHLEEHRDIATPSEWRACKAQQFRRGGPGVHQILWEVEEDVEEGKQTEVLIRAIMKEMETVLRVVEAPEDARMVSPWLLTAGWHERLSGRDAKDLMDLVAIPKRHDGQMPLLKESVESYYEGALALLSTTDELTLQRLNSPDP